MQDMPVFFCLNVEKQARFAEKSLGKHSTFYNDKKSRKKCLTLPSDSDRIAKLSQRDGSERSAGSRPIEGREQALAGTVAKRVRKKILKKSKKVLDKANLM